MVDEQIMEIQNKLSACWESFLACFKKPNQAGRGTGHQENDRPAGDVDNVVVDQNTENDFTSKRFPVKKDGNCYIALYNYSARTEEDLSFNAGDTLEALDKSAGDWWFAKALTGLSACKQGYIPANYVALLESIDAEP